MYQLSTRSSNEDESNLTTMWLTVILGGVLLYLIYRFVKFWVLDSWLVYRHFRSQGIPGRYIPIVGDIFGLRRAILADKHLEYATEMTTKFGDYYQLSFGPITGFIISDPLLLQNVLKTNVRAYHKSILIKLMLRTIIGNNNLILAENDVHAYHRRLVAPAFHHQNLNSMISLMVETASHQLAKFEISARRNQNNVLTIDIHKEMAHLTLNILAGCVFGTSIQDEKPVHETVSQNIALALNEVEKRAFNLLAIIPFVNRLPLPSKLCIDSSMRDVRRIVQHIIDERKKGLTKSTCKGPDLLDLLLTAQDDGKNEKFTDEEIYEEAVTFVIAGHETTSGLMTWALYNLASNPEVYRRCVDEVDSVMSVDNELTASVLSLLTYTEAVLKESLRLYPSVPLLFRTAVADNTLVASDGKHIHIKKGTEVVLNLYMLHHSEKYWPEPHKFDPSRFDNYQSELFLPFSAGSRSCIGQNFAMLEAKILLATIVRQFHFELVPGQKYVPDVAITMRPKYGMWMRLTPR